MIVNGAPTRAVRVDRTRVDRVMESIARGIYCHETGHRWGGRLRVDTKDLMMPNFSSSPKAKDVARLESLVAPELRSVCGSATNAPTWPPGFWSSSARPDPPEQGFLCLGVAFGCDPRLRAEFTAARRALDHPVVAILR